MSVHDQKSFNNTGIKVKKVGAGRTLKNDPAQLPWPGGSVAWSVVLYIKTLRVRFLIRHIPRLQVPSQVRVLTGGNQSMILSYQCLSLSLPFLLKSVNISSGKD